MPDAGDQAAQEELRMATRALEAMARMAKSKMRRDPRARTISQRYSDVQARSARVLGGDASAEGAADDQGLALAAAIRARAGAVPDAAFAAGDAANAAFTLSTVRWDAECALFRGHMDELLGAGNYAAAKVAGADAWRFEVAPAHAHAVRELVDAECAHVNGMRMDRFAFEESFGAALGTWLPMETDGRDEPPLEDALSVEVDDDCVAVVEEVLRESGVAFEAIGADGEPTQIVVDTAGFVDAQPRVEAAVQRISSLTGTQLAALRARAHGRASVAARAQVGPDAPARTVFKATTPEGPHVREVSRSAKAATPAQDRKVFERAARERAAAVKVAERDRERSR